MKMKLKPNKALLKRTLTYIEEHPEEWEQTKYRCGTQACFAGHAALLSGSEWVNERGTFAYVKARGAQLREHVNERAQRVLRLSTDQAYVLFRATATLSNLREIVKRFCAL